MSQEAKDKREASRKQKAGCEQIIAEPKRPRSDLETDAKEDKIEDDDEVKEERYERVEDNPFVGVQIGDIDEDDAGNDDSIVDEALITAFIRQPNPRYRGVDEGLRSGGIDRDLPSFRGTPGQPNLHNIMSKTGTNALNLGPLDLWHLFFTVDMCEQFVTETNRYAHNSEEHKHNWTDITLEDFRVVIAIILYMSVVDIGDRRLYWSTGIYRQYFFDSIRTRMSTHRFDSIVTCLHFEDRVSFSFDELEAKRKANPFWQVDNFVHTLSTNFSAYYTLGRCFDVDEMSIYFKGKHICRCYNPNKPEKWHFKAFALNCSVTGYAWTLYLYHGAAEVRPHGVSATSFPVRKLTANPILHHRNHILAIDNWYTSIEVALHLLEIGIHVLGTIKTNRKGIPKEAVLKKTGPKKARGFYHCFSAIVRNSTPQKRIFFHGWQDSKPVHVLSTFQLPLEECVRKTFNDRGGFERIKIARPGVISLYNHAMGGTDLIDQLCSYIRTTLRTNKWPVRIFTHMINLSVVNAHILHKSLQELSVYKIHDFVTDMIKELVPDVVFVFPPPDVVSSNPSNPAPKKVSSWTTDNNLIKLRLSKDKPHYLEAGCERAVCRSCGDKRITTACITCQASLCTPNRGEGEESCFYKFHNCA